MNNSHHTTIFINDENVGRLANWSDVITALTDAYAQPMTATMVPPRTMARGDGFWLRSLCAVSPSKEYMGCKLIAASPKNKKASYLISLFDQETMRLAALIDGNRITDIRTAASSAVAVNALAAQDKLDIAIIGSGAVARGHLHALNATGRVQRVRVFSPTQANREKFAETFQNLYGLDILAVASAEEAVAGANVVICASRSKDESPVFNAAWLEPGMTIVSVSSTLPEQRELDVETMQRATLIVADMPEEVLHETGDALAVQAIGDDIASKTVSLADVVSNNVTARKNPEDILIYKSVGSALQDIVTAEMLLRNAKLESLFQDMPESIVTIDR
ncbi:ornithine cyclodeaminase [Acinetobacter sp. ANC 4654]|uniref:ornithine cyclodeaminase family protein n=1 Tax=Acinetobacter sp. ANC 4654 TaxID=1977872 RepID=UPI000A35BD30|nr:ornithine cyclodeaminase family protein [Acinetobacter sp. ANC 4654]OTG92465.1 ornithine cyclodeaminase [Acinetobacter sp. ANC 4654]